MAEERVAALPRYIGTDFADAPPGHRFGLYLTCWDGRFNLVKDKKREGLKAVVPLSSYSRELVAALRERQVRAAQSLGPSILHVSARSTSPFVTGTGIEHPLENGFAFLNPYGLPYLPGSGIKGVIRHAAEELALGLWGEGRGWDMASVWWLFGFEANSAYLRGPDDKMRAGVVGEQAKAWRERFLAAIRSGQANLKGVAAFIEKAAEEATRGKYREDPEGFLERLAEERVAGPRSPKLLREEIHFSGVLRFWDALIQPASDMTVDILNPHFGDYYQKGHSPADCGQPEPNFFLTVPAGSRFDFFVQLVGNRLPEELSRTWRAIVDTAFQLAFDCVGFGAKGAVGYGRMERVLEKGTDVGAKAGALAAAGESAAAEYLRRRIKNLRDRDVRPQLQDIVQEIGRRPPGERSGLVEALRARLHELGFRPKQISDMLDRYPELRGKGAG